jgi:alanyl-tRNA synthetase
MTKVCRIPAEKLWFTVHIGDDDAYNIWLNEIGVPPERLLRLGDKTNFWMMGDIGPCGPTSEIHYDWGPQFCTCGQPNCSVLLDNDCGRWLEVWNLVFMQFNQAEDGARTPLPRPGVDTGMGLERITSVVQQTPANYDNDLFAAAMDRVQAMLGDTAGERAEKYIGYRVIADHSRAATFLIADGVLPGNEGGGYVLRMIIRRAARYARKIGFTRPFLAEVAQVYIDKMGPVYPELKMRQEHIRHTLLQEEERFTRTLDAALTRLDTLLSELAEQGQRRIPGEVAFNLYTTYGLPVEITRDVAGERGFTVDEAAYNAARQAHALASGSGAFGDYQTDSNIYGQLLADLVQAGRLASSGVHYDPYSGPAMTAAIVGLTRDGRPVANVAAGDKAEVITTATPFYLEAGGEISDTGHIVLADTDSVFRVDDVRQPVAGLILHVGQVMQGEITAGQEARLQVNEARRHDIRRHHTATHILHQELRRHLGAHVTQAGSLVAPDRLRFDFAYGQAVDKETLARIEAAINEVILANKPVHVTYMKQTEAINQGAMALFGEKYGATVRTIKIGQSQKPYSFELCGGLHVSHTGEIGPFRFISEGAVAAGVRRVEAVAGHAAQTLIAGRLNALDRLAHRLNTPVSDVEARLEALLAEQRLLSREIEQLRRQVARREFDSLLERMQQVDGANILVAHVTVPDAEGLRQMADWFRDKVASGAAVLATVNNDKPLIIATVTEDLIQRGLKAGDLVREVAKIVGGGGGGRPNLAQAGGRDASKLPQALAIVPALVEQALS